MTAKPVPKTVTLTLTPQEQHVLTYYFALGGLVAYGETVEHVRRQVEDAQSQEMPAWWDGAEGSLQRKMLASERELGAIPPDMIDELDKRRREAWRDE